MVLKKYLLMFFCTITFPVMIHAQVLLVSDIDDTIKISHVHSFIDKVQLGLSTNSRFKSMNALYHALAKEQNAQVLYLSNAPDWLMYVLHAEFLHIGKFPPGELVLRKNESERMHKVYELRKWLDDLKPTTVILIGDNSEYDTLIYNQIVNEYKNKSIDFHQYIRIAYDLKKGMNLKPHQIGFVSPLEILLDLKQKRLLSAKTANDLALNISEKILNESGSKFGEPSFFPDWLKCPQWKKPQSTFLLSEVQKTLTYIEKNICFEETFWGL